MHRGVVAGRELELPLEGELDALLAAVFDGPAGSARLGEACESYDQVVGRVFEDDPGFGELRLLRADWALCEWRRPDGLRWIDACVRGEIDGVDRGAAARIARSVAGAFELWSGKELWIRDRLRGVCARLIDPLIVPMTEEGARAQALWDARIVIGPEGAQLCRVPFAYPDAAREVLDRRSMGRVPGEPRVGLLELRRAWLRWTRARRRQPFDL